MMKNIKYLGGEEMKCKNCEELIKGDTVLCCSCGSFCSVSCQTKYHGLDKIENETKEDC